MDRQALPGIGIKPVLSLKRHWRAALAAAAATVLLGLPFAWIKGRSHYVAESVFQVAPSYMKNLDTDKELELQSNSQYREYVNHLSSTVTRYDVLERALDGLKARGIDRRPASLTQRKYIERLQRTVYVRALPDTYMVRIGTEDREPEYLHDLVNAISESFVATSRAEQIYGSGERLDVLHAGVERLNGEIRALETQRVTLAARLGLTSFGEKAESPYDAMLVQVREKLAAASVERVQAEAALAAFDRQREVPTSQGRSLLETRLQDSGLQALRNEVVKRSEELNRVIAGLEDRHPARQDAVAELATIRQRLKSQESQFDRETFDNFRSRLVASVNQRVQVEKALRQAAAQVEGQASEYARDFQEAMRLTAEIRKRDGELAHLRDRLNYLDTEANALGFVRLVTPALPAETPQGIGKTRLLLALLLAAVAAALVVPVGLDLLDRRIRSVNDAENLMGIPAAGWQVLEVDLPTRLFAREQNRRFASTLIRTRARGGRNVFAFTAVKSGAGVTRTVLDAAHELTQLGARVLVVEADTVRPCHEFARAVGLSDYLAGHAALDGLARPHAWRGSALEVVGIGLDREHGLKRLDRFQAALDHWSCGYDYVLVDLPPLLLSADAELLIETLGQVFMVVDAEGVARGEVLRAKRLLERIDPEAIGLVVSKVPVFRGAGYLERLIVETVARTRFDRFMTLARSKLWWAGVRARMLAFRPRLRAGGLD